MLGVAGFAAAADYTASSPVLKTLLPPSSALLLLLIAAFQFVWSIVAKRLANVQADRSPSLGRSQYYSIL
jgi:hypothetical protein